MAPGTSAEVIVVGGGLSGLRTASLLAREGVDVKLLEARHRVGGRLLSLPIEVGQPQALRFDLGATWFWPTHNPRVLALAKDLGLSTLLQHEEGDLLIERSAHQPPQRFADGGWETPEALRLAGGAQALAEALARTLPKGVVLLDAPVTSLERHDQGIAVAYSESRRAERSSLAAKVVVLAIPARVIARRMEFTPALGRTLLASMAATPTWMAGHAKAVAVYPQPFWRAEGLAGKAMSAVGPLQEIHDASPAEGAGALFGFFRTEPAARSTLTEADVREQVLRQLTRLFGPRAATPVGFLYKDWATDSFTATAEDTRQPQVHAPSGLLPIGSEWSANLVLSGTERSSHHGGYLEGALDAAEMASQRCLELLA